MSEQDSTSTIDDVQINIIRTPKNSDNPYAMIHRMTLQDRNLSWEAHGVLDYLLSKPNDWELKPSDLEGKDCGRDKVYRILKELIEEHYLVREELRVRGRVAGYSYRVYERPQSPLPEKPDTAPPDTANTDITYIEKKQNTDSDKENTKTIPPAVVPASPTPDLEEKKALPPPLTSPGSIRREPRTKFKGQPISETPKEPSELARAIAAAAGANKLEPAQTKQIAEPVIAFKGGKTLTMPSLEEMYRDNAVFRKFVEHTLTRMISQTKKPYKPSRTRILQVLSNFNLTEVGWFAFELMHGKAIVSPPTSAVIEDPLDKFFN